MKLAVTFWLGAQGARGLRPCSARPLHLEQLPFGFIARGVRHDPIAISYSSYETASFKVYIQIRGGVCAVRPPGHYQVHARGMKPPSFNF